MAICVERDDNRDVTHALLDDLGWQLEAAIDFPIDNQLAQKCRNEWEPVYLPLNVGPPRLRIGLPEAL